MRILITLLLIITTFNFTEATTLQEKYQSSGPGAGYDKFIQLDRNSTYTGGLTVFGSYFHENFDGAFLPEGWAIVDAGMEATWDVSFIHNYSLPKAAHHAFYMPQEVDDWLISPSIDITGTYNILSFYQLCENIPDENSSHSIMVSTGSPVPEDGDFQQIASIDEPSDGWHKVIVDLSSYIGQSVYIAFHAQGFGLSTWTIDEVSVGSGAELPQTIRIAGNGSVIDLQGENIFIPDNIILEVEGTIFINGGDALGFGGDAKGRIINNTFYNNSRAIAHNSNQEIYGKNNIIMESGEFGVFKKTLIGTFYLEYNCAYLNGASGNSHYIYFCPG